MPGAGCPCAPYNLGSACTHSAGCPAGRVKSSTASGWTRSAPAQVRKAHMCHYTAGQPPPASGAKSPWLPAAISSHRRSPGPLTAQRPHAHSCYDRPASPLAETSLQDFITLENQVGPGLSRPRSRHKPSERDSAATLLCPQPMPMTDEAPRLSSEVSCRPLKCRRSWQSRTRRRSGSESTTAPCERTRRRSSSWATARRGCRSSGGLDSLQRWCGTDGVGARMAPAGQGCLCGRPWPTAAGHHTFLCSGASARQLARKTMCVSTSGLQGTHLCSGRRLWAGR